MIRHQTSDIRHQWLVIGVLSVVCCLWSVVCAEAGQWPSLFRGVVVADPATSGETHASASGVGVRVISVEEQSQAAYADLRPEDLIIQIDDAPVRSIDEFATLSLALKGRATKAQLVILRQGNPRTLTLHVYSYPILRQWDVAFVPEHDIRFVDPKAARAYWLRMAQGFEVAGDPKGALHAVLNTLHHEPQDVDLAVRAASLLCDIAQRQLAAKHLSEALTAIQQSTTLLRRVFDVPVTQEQLQRIHTQLSRTLDSLHAYRTTLDK